jgi:hypothetical protein
MPVQTKKGRTPVAPEYTGISISHGARDDLRMFKAQAGGVLGRSINMSDALRLAVRIATAHLSTDGPEAWQLITEPNGEAP